MYNVQWTTYNVQCTVYMTVSGGAGGIPVHNVLRKCFPLVMYIEHHRAVQWRYIRQIYLAELFLHCNLSSPGSPSGRPLYEGWTGNSYIGYILTCSYYFVNWNWQNLWHVRASKGVSVRLWMFHQNTLFLKKSKRSQSGSITSSHRMGEASQWNEAKGWINISSRTGNWTRIKIGMGI